VVLVTGGAGFIGSHLTERLLGMGASVTVYDRFDEFYPGKERNLAGAVNNPRFRLVNGDILDVDRLDSAMKDVDVVFHQAGQAGIGFSVKHPVQVNNVNVNGTLNVLSLGKKHGVDRIVNASGRSTSLSTRTIPPTRPRPTGSRSSRRSSTAGPSTGSTGRTWYRSATSRSTGQGAVQTR
jgi:nucleoside-diphosphate-sugar epimerase